MSRLFVKYYIILYETRASVDFCICLGWRRPETFPVGPRANCLWFLKLGVHQNLLRDLLKHRTLGPTLSLDSVGLGCGSRISISSKFPGSDDTASPRDHIWRPSAVQTSKQPPKNTLHHSSRTLSVDHNCLRNKLQPLI